MADRTLLAAEREEILAARRAGGDEREGGARGGGRVPDAPARPGRATEGLSEAVGAPWREQRPARRGVGRARPEGRRRRHDPGREPRLRAARGAARDRPG